jgi:hypothetical protein
MTFIQSKYTRWYYDIIDRAATLKANNLAKKLAIGV